MSSATPMFGPSALALRSLIETVRHPSDLQAANSALWQNVVVGTISDEEAEHLDAMIRARQALQPAPSKPRLPSLFRPRQRTGSPDRRAARERRRDLGGSGDMPPLVRRQLSEGLRAVAAIIAGEVKTHGVCELPIARIADLAGVCRTTVQTALHEVRRMGWIIITERRRAGNRSLTNVVRIISAEWLAWLKRGSTRHRPDKMDGSKTLTTPEMPSPLKSTEREKSTLRNNYKGWSMLFDRASPRYVPPGATVAGLRGSG